MDAEISEGKGTQNLLLQVISGILLLSLSFVKHTSYPYIFHTHAFTQAVDPISVYILCHVRPCCILSTISTKLPTQ